jgi:5'-3' exonuclease
MGIPYYFYTLTKKYNNIISTTLLIKPDIYCIDFNGIIHPIAHDIISKSKTDKEISEIENNIHIKLYEKVEEYIKNINPYKTIICVDGIVPIAKINQQRKRRYLSVYKNKIDNITNKWDTNAITPGTTFMNNLNQYFKNKIRYSINNIIYSGSDEFGEGEHKIFKKLSLYIDTDESPNILINGLDADLIILSLLSHRKNIFLMRELLQDSGEYVTNYLNIDNLKDAILKELSIKWEIANCAYETNDIIESYCVMCSILGNDFIPHLLTLNLKSGGLDNLIKFTGISIKEHGLLVSNSTINYECLLSIIKMIEKTEDRDIYVETEKYLKRNHHNSDIPSEYFAVKNKDPLATIIYSDLAKWRNNYYKYLFGVNIYINTSIISSACENYIKGILWTYYYYKNIPIDNTWYYPYSYPPSAKDIVNYIIGNNVLPEIKDVKINYDSNIQLLIVLPIDSRNLLNNKYSTYLSDYKKGLKHMYPIKYKIYTYLKTHLWECNPLLPTIDIEYICDIVK